MSIATEQTFAPPSQGTWFLDPTHFTRPVTRFHSEIFPREFKRGFGESLRRYGSLLDHLDWEWVNGFPYYSPRPVGAPPDATGPPPKEVWDELAENDPEIGARLATSAAVFERKLWREDLERWDSEVKPALIQEHRALLEVDPTTLDTLELMAYLDRCRENQKHGAYVHHLFNMPAFLPVGDFLVHAQRWTGRSPAELLSLLQGANPDPLGADEELARLATAIRHDPDAQALLSSPNEPAEVLAALRAFPGDVGEAASRYVETVGFRPVNGEDPGEPCVIELPELIIGAIRSAVDEGGEVGDTMAELERRTADVRAAVVEEHRAEFDEVLSEARLVYRLRDERGTYADLWAIGIMRRAILAAGARLVQQGRIADPSHLVECSYAELRGLVAGGDGPSADELAERARYRMKARYTDAPPILGSPPSDPLPLEWLPPAAARLEGGLGAAVHALFVAPEAQTEAQKVRGLGVSPGDYEGRARLVRGTKDFGRIEQGDVLVTNSTTTAFNIVLPLLGAIVTDRGGLLSHAAIVSREYGIPAVVGCTDATAIIPDGALVRVDGREGEVEVIR